MNREDRIAEDWENQRKGTGLVYLMAQKDVIWLVETVRAARKLRDAVIERPDDVVSTSPYSNLAKAMGGPFGDLSVLLREES